MDKIKRIILNPLIISAVICFVVYLLLPSVFNKYDLEQSKQYYQENVLEYRHDIDQDSYSELIRLGYNFPESKDFPLIIITDFDTLSQKAYTHSQNNFDAHWLEQPGLCFGDYNNNYSDEIYFFTHKNDSLFLYGHDPDKVESLFLTRFISNVTFIENNPDFEIYFGGMNKINNDSFGDIVFTIWSGFSMEPRAIYMYDVKNDSLINTETQDVCFIRKPLISFDKLSGPVIFSESYAPANQKNGGISPYADSVSWLMVFDRNLQLLFPPVEYGSFTSDIMGVPISFDSVVTLYLRFTQPGDYGESYLVTYDLSGNILKKRMMKGLRGSYLISPEKSVNNLFLKTTEKLIKIDQNLETIKEFPFNFPGSILNILDIDNDGENEILIYNSNIRRLTICRDDFSHPISINLPDDLSHSHVSKSCLPNSEINLMIHTNGRSLNFIYKRNKLYFFKYPIFLGVYFLISAFFFLLLKLQKDYLQSKHEQEMKVNELVLLTIKNQIEPHFTFNVINSISSMIYEEDRKKAYQFLLDFSKLIRASLTNARKIEIKLSAELEFVERYLNLEEIRFKKSFDFDILVSPDVNKNQLIPRMIIHTFAENAVKHGLANKSKDGYLKINTDYVDNHLQISIEDNGIGRAKAKDENKSSTGKGLEIVDQIIELYKKLHHSTVSYKFEDLYNDEQQATGTRVTIKIPHIDKKQ